MTEPNESQSALGFDLRDKIAAVLRSHWPGECGDTDADESPIDHLTDVVIRELNLAKACEGGCVWQIPNRFEDMTPAQRELLEPKPISVIGCVDPWHAASGPPWQCPTCKLWMGEAYDDPRGRRITDLLKKDAADE